MRSSAAAQRQPRGGGCAQQAAWHEARGWLWDVAKLACKAGWAPHPGEVLHGLQARQQRGGGVTPPPLPGQRVQLPQAAGKEACPRHSGGDGCLDVSEPAAGSS